MKKTFRRCAGRMVLIVPFAAFVIGPSVASAGSLLGSAVNFAVLGASTVTNTDNTTIVGDVGLSPGSSITGFGTVTLTGTVHQTDLAAANGQSDVTTAYNALAAMALPSGHDISLFDLGTLTLLPGVYKFTSSAQLTGTLHLVATGDPNALFVFQIGSTLTTGSNSVVSVVGGNANTGVFWQVGSSATIGDSTTFLGNILAYTDISLDSSATICGRALARGAGDVGGAVTMIGNTILDTCPASVDFGSHGFAGAGTTLAAVPEPGTVPLLCMGLFALTLYGWKSRKRVA